MTVTESIQIKIQENFAPLSFELINESHMHSGPRTESHFKVILCSEAFVGKRLVQRHQLVHKCLSEELKVIHALSLKLYTPEEWQTEHDQVPASPKCAGKRS